MSTIEDLIRELTGKSLEEMSDDELRAWIQNTRDMYRRATVSKTKQARTKPAPTTTEINEEDLF